MPGNFGKRNQNIRNMDQQIQERDGRKKSRWVINKHHQLNHKVKAQLHLELHQAVIIGQQATDQEQLNHRKSQNQKLHLLKKLQVCHHGLEEKLDNNHNLEHNHKMEKTKTEMDKSFLKYSKIRLLPEGPEEYLHWEECSELLMKTNHEPWIKMNLQFALRTTELTWMKRNRPFFMEYLTEIMTVPLIMTSF